MEPGHVFGIVGVVVGILGLLSRWSGSVDKQSSAKADNVRNEALQIKESLHRDITHVRDTLDWLVQHVSKNDRDTAGIQARHEEKLASAFERLAKVESKVEALINAMEKRPR